MHIAAAVVGLAEVALAIAREHLMDERLAAVSVRPCEVLGSPKVDLVKFLRSFVAEERMLQLAHPVDTLEKQPERMFGVARTTACSATNAQPRRPLELIRCAIHRRNLLDHRKPLPLAAVVRTVLRRIHVNTRRCAKEERRINNKRYRVNGVRKAALDPIAEVGDDGLVHAIEHRLIVHFIVGRESGRRIGILRQDIIEKEVGRGGILLQYRVILQRRRPDDRCARDGNRVRVENRLRRGRGAVQRVINFLVRRIRA